jgi:hypothetical protein
VSEELISHDQRDRSGRAISPRSRPAHDQAVTGDEHQILAPTLLLGVVVGGRRCLPPGEQAKSQRDLSRTLKLAASVLGDGDEPLLRFPRGEDTVPSRQRLAAVAVLADREAGLSAVQPLATKHVTRRDVRAHHGTQIV